MALDTLDFFSCFWMSFSIISEFSDSYYSQLEWFISPHLVLLTTHLLNLIISCVKRLFWASEYLSSSVIKNISNRHFTILLLIIQRVNQLKICISNNEQSKCHHYGCSGSFLSKFLLRTNIWEASVTLKLWLLTIKYVSKD